MARRVAGASGVSSERRGPRERSTLHNPRPEMERELVVEEEERKVEMVQAMVGRQKLYRQWPGSAWSTQRRDG